MLIKQPDLQIAYFKSTGPKIAWDDDDTSTCWSMPTGESAHSEDEENFQSILLKMRLY